MERIRLVEGMMGKEKMSSVTVCRNGVCRCIGQSSRKGQSMQKAVRARKDKHFQAGKLIAKYFSMQKVPQICYSNSSVKLGRVRREKPCTNQLL